MVRNPPEQAKRPGVDNAFSLSVGPLMLGGISDAIPALPPAPQCDRRAHVLNRWARITRVVRFAVDHSRERGSPPLVFRCRPARGGLIRDQQRRVSSKEWQQCAGDACRARRRSRWRARLTTV